MDTCLSVRPASGGGLEGRQETSTTAARRLPSAFATVDGQLGHQSSTALTFVRFCRRRIAEGRQKHASVHKEV
jgi:hypothetical protein